jgi:hypothetical protein
MLLRARATKNSQNAPNTNQDREGRTKMVTIQYLLPVIELYFAEHHNTET